MKAIINTKKASGFSYLNGRTYKVKEVFTSFVAIEIPSQICEGRFDTCDFNHNEVLIADIDAEVQRAYDNFNWGSDNKTYIRLKDYCRANRIKTNEQLTTIA